MKVEQGIPAVDIHMSLRVLDLLLQVMGMYVPSNRRGARRVLQRIYCCLVHLLSFSNIARFYFVLNMDEGLSVMTTLSYFLMYIGAALYSVVFLMTSRHWETLMKMYGDFQLQFGFNINMNMFSHTIKILCWLIYILTFISSVFAYVYLMYSGVGMFNRFLVPLSYLQGTMKLFGGVYIFCASFIFFGSQFGSMMTFFGITYCIIKEFGAINAKVSRMIEKGLIETDFEKLRQQHARVCAVMNEANRTMNHFLFFTYVTAIPLLCFHLFGLIRGSLPLEEFWLSIFSAFGGITSCFTATIAGALLSSKAHGCLDDLMKAKLPEMSLKTLQSMSIFVSRLTGPSIGYSLYGLFTVDSSAILTILGTLLTYAIVVVQFQPVDPILITAVTNSTI